MQFYKFKNGNSSFEYEVESHLKRLEDKISDKHTNLLCGVFSAGIAFCFQDELNQHNKIWCILFLLVTYSIFWLAIKLALVLYQSIIVRKKYREPLNFVIRWLDERWNWEIEPIDEVSDEAQIEAKALFWNKIVSAVVQGISLVNRLDDIKREDEIKKDLIPIYGMEAEYMFEYASELIRKSALTKKGNDDIVEAIGLEAINWLFGTSVKYLRLLYMKTSSEDTRLRIELMTGYYENWRDYFLDKTEEKRQSANMVLKAESKTAVSMTVEEDIKATGVPKLEEVELSFTETEVENETEAEEPALEEGEIISTETAADEQAEPVETESDGGDDACEEPKVEEEIEVLVDSETEEEITDVDTSENVEEDVLIEDLKQETEDSEAGIETDIPKDSKNNDNLGGD